MREMKRNRQTVYYALYNGVQECVDSAGNYTGEYAPAYGTPVEVKMNVSAAKGNTVYTQFGIDTPYSKVLVTTDMACPITEESILWIGTTPSTGEHNYVVTKVAKSINSISIAVKEVDISSAS